MPVNYLNKTTLFPCLMEVAFGASWRHAGMNQLKQTGPAREVALYIGHVSRFAGHGVQVVNLLQERARFCRGDLRCPKAVGEVLARVQTYSRRC